MEITAMVCRFSVEETPMAEGATIVAFDVEDYARQVNAALPGLGATPLLMLDRAYMEGHWIEPMLAELAITNGIVSPWFRMGEQPRAWHDPICPSAWMIRADLLQQIGGLHEELMFGQAQVIAHRAREWRVSISNAPGAVCTPSFTPSQAQRAGDLYYRQIQDDNKIQQIIGGS